MSKGKKAVCAATVADIIDAFEPDVALIERVHAMKGQGVSSCFNFGVSYGVVQGVVTAHRIPVHLITPQEWKKHHRLSSDKGAARGLASRLIPAQADLFSRVRDDGRAEAALLALFGLCCVVPQHRAALTQQ
jgi:crossover junction endodeoxyribonuclease RuvC